MKTPGPKPIHPAARQMNLPLQESGSPVSYGAKAATLILEDPYTGTALAVNQDALVVDNYGILPRDVEQVCFSHSAYNDSFKEYLDMTKFYPSNHPAGGMHFIIEDNRLMLHNMAKGSPCAKLKDWRSRLKGARLISVNGIPVQSVADINTIFNDCLTSGIRECTLLFSHLYIRHGLTNEGIPQISLDQINPRRLFHGNTPPAPPLCT
jgi:hypothetical protein